MLESCLPGSKMLLLRLTPFCLHDSSGANPLTLSGLGGLGDLVLTCTGDASRNR